MFNMTYDTPCKIQGTIRLTKPVQHLGLVIDINGKRWDIRSIFGMGQNCIVQACQRSSLHTYYTDTGTTSCYGVVHQIWKPYRIEIVINEK